MRAAEFPACPYTKPTEWLRYQRGYGLGAVGYLHARHKATRRALTREQAVRALEELTTAHDDDLAVIYREGLLQGLRDYVRND